MLGSLVAIALAAAPVKLATPGFQGVHVDRDVIEFCTAHLSQQLGARGLPVITPQDVSTMLGLERQKQLLGCSDATGNCMAELANALGVDAIVVGQVAKFGTALQLDIKVLSATDVRPLVTFAQRVDSEEKLVSAIDAAAEAIAHALPAKLGRAAGPSLATSASEPSPGLRRWAWAPTAAGVVLAGVGVGFALKAKGDHDTLAQPGRVLSMNEARGIVSDGQTSQTIASATFALSGAAVATGLLFYLLGGDTAGISVAPSVEPSGLTVGVSGRW